MTRRKGQNDQPGSGPVTMAAVGRLAGVSQATVSRALANPSRVSPDTLERIQKAIAQTGFVPNALAGALASRKSGLISALVPSITNIVYSGLLHGFSEIMRAEGYQIMLSETGFDPAEEEALITTHLSRRPDGFLLTGIHHSSAARKMLLGANFPVVEVWDLTETPVDCCVGFSHVDAGQAAADFAFDAGYRRAATVCAADERARRRRDAFARGFARRGGQIVQQVDFSEGSATLERGRQALRDLVKGKGCENGIVFCSSDLFAHGVMIEAQAIGLRIPKDLAVFGFGDQDFAAHTNPTLTTVRVNRDNLGRAAAKALLSRFQGDTQAPKSVDIGFQVIRRQSA